MKYHKICKCCGKPFETNSPQKLFCNREHYLPCPVCGKPVLKKDRDFTRPPKCCSSKCTHELRKRNLKPRQCVICNEWFVPKSGVQLICEKQHYKKCVICGKEFPVDNGNYKTAQTCSDECRRKNTIIHNLEKYGTEHPMQNPEVQMHHREAMREKYGVEFALQSEEFMRKQQETAYETNMKNNGVPYACMLPQCIEAQGNIVSKRNKEFASKLENLGIQTSLEFRINNMSYDIAIPDKKILVEIDPSYTHNSYYNHFGQPREKHYHQKKSENARIHGYRCIHIFDWDSETKIIQSLIQNNQVIGARRCKIYKLFPQYGDDFLRRYHLQGTCRGQLLYVGLEYQNRLVQVMTFGKSRYDKHHTLELLRLCTLPGMTIIGGASKLFKWATEYYELDDIISYCDLAKFNGEVYQKIGMKLLRTTPPAKIWSKGSRKITDNLLRQRGYDQLFKTNYGKGSSNEELMLKHDWLPIYDCGQNVYVYKQ